jgi:hypothetical protein
MENYYYPNYIKEYNIYDIFFNDNGTLVLIMPMEGPLHKIQYINNNEFFDFEYCICPHNHTYVYTLQTEYKREIELKIEDVILNTFANKYPQFKDEIIYSTLVKNEDNYIIQWIEFHKRLGVSRFVIYDNSNKSTLCELLDDYIQRDIVFLIKWEYVYRLPNSGFSAQTTQQNHSIYAFQNSKLIGLFDVDEYINMQSNMDLHSFFENIVKEQNININEISAFKILNKLFYNSNNMPSDGYNFLKIFNCDAISLYEREKMFAIPKNTKIASIHSTLASLPLHIVDPTKMYFNHYFFLNKKGRGLDKKEFLDCSILDNVDISSFPELKHLK